MEKFRFSKKPNKAHLIKWRPWSKAAFDEAKARNKPVYLSLAAVWCHWCHVMDETTLSHQPSIDYLNENFIPIRVDTDKRPDIQNRYILGGWPTTAFLTDEGDIISGGTYMPPEEFFKIIKKVKKDWAQNKDEILEKAKSRRQDVLERVAADHPSKPTLAYVDVTLEIYKNAFDDKFGGFGKAMKFPSPLTMELFLREAETQKRDDLLDIVTTTLDNMAEGEIFDREEGGFFRYATERDWSRPHFEKILSENAQIIMNYLHAYEINEKQLYLEIATKSLDYVNKFLANHPSGGFFGSQDADEEFYELKAEQRKAKNKPFIDKTIYADFNAQMVSTYLEAYRILDEKKYFGFAHDTMRFLQNNLLSNIGAAHYYNEEEGASVFGLISDQAQMLQALVDLYEHNPEIDFLTQANDLVDVLTNRLAGDGSFFDKPKEEDDIGNLQIRYKPIKENSLLAIALDRLSILTNSKDFSDLAKKILSSFDFSQAKDDFISMSPYALALGEVFGEKEEKAA